VQIVQRGCSRQVRVANGGWRSWRETRGARGSRGKGGRGDESGLDDSELGWGGGRRGGRYSARELLTLLIKGRLMLLLRGRITSEAYPVTRQTVEFQLHATKTNI